MEEKRRGRGEGMRSEMREFSSIMAWGEGVIAHCLVAERECDSSK
jgi:hypothetical protein